jgi:hypothetical protein
VSQFDTEFGFFRFVVAANMTMNEGDILHYRLRVSVVPPNIDVWGWVKYYREPFEAEQQQQQTSVVSNKNKNKFLKPLLKPKSQGDIGMFDQKHLLTNDTQMNALHRNNLTLRKSLALLDASIGMGILVENWSAYPLGKPTLELNVGTTVNDNDSIPAPAAVKPGAQNVGIILQVANTILSLS